MKKFYFLVLAFLFNFIFSQNSEIKMVGGASLQSPNYYCPAATFNLAVDDYFSNSTSTIKTLPLSVFNSIISSATGETNVLFNAAFTVTDKFSYPIDLDFNFKFFNKTYTRVVLGSNGRLVFTNDTILGNLNDTATYFDRTFSGNRLSTPQEPGVPLPSIQYNEIYKTGDITREIKMAQIFAGFTKLRVNSSTGGYKYKKFNDPVNGKGILITFQSVIPNDGFGTDLGPIYTSRIILFEDGRIVLNVQNKTAGNYNAILGMQNEDGNEKIIPGPSTYNNGIWSSSSGDAYEVKTGFSSTPTYLWELDRNNDGTVEEISSTRTFPNYTPVNDIERLSVKIFFSETSAMKTSEVIFKKIKSPIIQGTLDCSYDMKVNDAIYDAALQYTWYRVGETSAVGSGRNLSLHRKGSTIGDYYVKISNSNGTPLCPGANESNRLTFNNQRFPDLVKNSYCLVDNTLTPPASKTINLYDQFYPKYDPASGLEPYQIIFTTNTGVISDADAANFVVPANTELNLQFAVKEITGTNVCYNGALTLYYLSVLPTKTISVCASVTSYNLKSVFQNPAYPSYSYYYTYVDDGSMAEGNAIDVSRTVNVKTSIATCSTNTVVKFVLGATVTLPDVPMQERCKGSYTNANRFDFNLIKTTLDPTSQYDIKFYIKTTGQEIIPADGQPDSQPNLNQAGYFWSSVGGDFIVYAKVIDRADPTCFSFSNDIILRVYSKPSLRVFSPISLKNCLGNAIFDLRQDPSIISDAGSGINVKLEYYSGLNVLLSNDDTARYDAAILGTNPYVKVIYNISCSDIVAFDLDYYLKPTSLKSQILVCSELNYSLENFKNEVINNSADYTFTDLSDNSLPAKFDLSILPLTVSFLMKDNTTGCISEPQTLTFKKNSNSALMTAEIDYSICDTDFDGKTSFNLDSKRALFTNDATAVFEYFKDADLTQSISSNYSNETAFTQTIFARITIPSYCPSIGKIILKVNTPIKSSTLKDQYDICFGETLTIDVGSENTIFAWSNGQTGQTGTFTEAGTYSVILKSGSNGCPYTHNFTISDENQPKIKVIDQTNNSIEVIAAGGVKPYRYYFNGIPQTTNILLNPTASSYVIQVESKTGCIGPPKTIYFIKINNAFSPNADGINDIWKIDNLDQMERVSIVIVDRNGTKVFESVNSNKVEWDGKHNNRTLPTSTYWYTVSWYDPVSLKSEQRQGWILMKNRN